jgi:hypothetical protein
MNTTIPIPLNKTLPKEEFTSHGGQYINLGTFKNKQSSITSYNPTLTHHVTITHDIQANQQNNDLRSGLSETRFHKGFQRRQKDQIQNIFADEERRLREEHHKVRQHRADVQNQHRGEMLKTINNRAGYDIITGNPKGEKIVVSKPEGIRSLPNQGLGPEAPARGQAVLRETDGRFFRPLGTGPSHDYRQDMLYREGLAKREKYTSIIQLGKKDLPSYGVEDQFSKSEYLKKSDRASTGLYEARIPGKFTPRKVPTEPSGNPAIVERWSTDIDLTNKTIRAGR